MSKIVAIVQARMGASRLPGKVMKDIVGKPMLWHIINRIKESDFIDKIILATTVNKKDDEIVDFAIQNNIDFFRGSEEDVLDRYYKTAKKYNVADIVRITADDPLKDPVVIDKAVKIYLESNADYVSNTIKPTYPLGLDVEIFSFNAIERAWKETDEKYEREHVTPYLWKNPEKFKIINVVHKGENLSHLRWTVDTKKDLDFVKAVYQQLYGDGMVFLMDDVLNLLKKHPNLTKINNNIKSKNICG